MLQKTSALIGSAINATDGSIGSVEALLFDEEASGIRWLVVDAGNWLWI